MVEITIISGFTATIEVEGGETYSLDQMDGWWRLANSPYAKDVSESFRANGMLRALTRALTILTERGLLEVLR